MGTNFSLNLLDFFRHFTKWKSLKMSTSDWIFKESTQKPFIRSFWRNVGYWFWDGQNLFCVLYFLFDCFSFSDSFSVRTWESIVTSCLVTKFIASFEYKLDIKILLLPSMILISIDILFLLFMKLNIFVIRVGKINILQYTLI